MTGKQLVLYGCGTAVLVVCLALAAVVSWVVWVAQDPAGVIVSVEGPPRVAVGEEFTLTVVVHNQRDDSPFELTDIDLAEEYLKEFLLVATDPPARSSMHVPLDDTRSFTFDRPVPAGEVARFGFRLRPTRAGLFRGDVDVCEGQRFLTTLMQTMVEAAGAGSSLTAASPTP